MITLDSPQIVLMAGGAVGVVYLVELDWTTGTLYYTTFNAPLTVGGHTYLAAGTLATVGDIKESQDTDTQTVSITLSVANAAVLSLALGNVEAYRGRKARLYLQPLDAQFRAVGAARLRFSGEMEPVKITRDKPGAEGGPVGGSIELPISRAGMSRARNQDGLRMTHEQQQAEFVGDLGFEYVRSLIATPSVWLSKRFQQQ